MFMHNFNKLSQPNFTKTFIAKYQTYLYKYRLLTKILSREAVPFCTMQAREMTVPVELAHHLANISSGLALGASITFILNYYV
jgi:hypothetical protein